MRTLKAIVHRARDFFMRQVPEQSGSNFSFADVAAQLQLKADLQSAGGVGDETSRPERGGVQSSFAD